MANKKTGQAKYFLTVAGVVVFAAAFAIFASRRVSFQPAAFAQTTGQTANQPAQQTQQPAATTSTARRSRRRRPVTPAAQPTAPGTTSGEIPAQKAQDQRLLSQQQAASQASKQVNDQQVQQYDAAKQKVQNEPRIQDAPGPAESPRAPVTPDPTGIQEAPGPAQTAPAPPATQPQL